MGLSVWQCPSPVIKELFSTTISQPFLARVTYRLLLKTSPTSKIPSSLPSCLNIGLNSFLSGKFCCWLQRRRRRKSKSETSVKSTSSSSAKAVDCVWARTGAAGQVELKASSSSSRTKGNAAKAAAVFIRSSSRRAGGSGYSISPAAAAAATARLSLLCQAPNSETRCVYVRSRSSSCEQQQQPFLLLPFRIFKANKKASFFSLADWLEREREKKKRRTIFLILLLASQHQEKKKEGRKTLINTLETSLCNFGISQSKKIRKAAWRRFWM